MKTPLLLLTTPLLLLMTPLLLLKDSAAAVDGSA
jgi:hypothetical protein